MPDYYIIEDPKLQPQDIGSKTIRRAVWLDDSVVTGAPYFEIVWIVSDIPKGPGIHRHDFDEFVGFMGGDVTAPMELGCEIVFQVGGEAMTLRNTCLIFIPAGTEHGLLSVKNVTTPVLNYSGGPNVAYKAVTAQE